jgi:hypothetical protein
LFAAKLVRWSEHPVLAKPVILRGLIRSDGCPGPHDLRVSDQLRQRAAMGGAKERAGLAAFENLLASSIAEALVTELQQVAAAHGVDVWTWVGLKVTRRTSEAAD